MKVAIIGCGSIAGSHVAYVKKSVPDAQIVLMDSDRSRAEFLASKWSIVDAYSDLDLMFSKVRPEAVHILTPPKTHFQLAAKALRSGCHVLIEKPVTETVAQFSEISALATKTNKILAVDYSTLGMPVVVKALRVIDSGELGRLISVHCNFACSWPGNTIPYADPNHWAYALKGGVLQNMADHPASLVLKAMNPIEESIISFTSHNLLPRNNPDLLHVCVKNDQQIGSFTLSLGHGCAERRAYFLLEKGSIMIDMSKQLFHLTKGQGPHNFIQKGVFGAAEGKAMILGTIGNIVNVMFGKLQKDPGIANIVDNFYKTIAGKEKLQVSYELALAVTTLLENVWEEMGDNRRLQNNITSMTTAQEVLN